MNAHSLLASSSASPGDVKVIDFDSETGKADGEAAESCVLPVVLAEEGGGYDDGVEDMEELCRKGREGALDTAAALAGAGTVVVAGVVFAGAFVP